MSNRGLTLAELLLVLVLLSIAAGMAAPRAAALVDGAIVHAEAANLVVALDAARGAAMRLGAPSRLTFSDSSYVVSAVVAAESLTAWRATGAMERGVHLSGAGQPLIFAPSGIAMGASNRTLVLSKGTVSRRVVISRLGRLTW